MPSAAIAGVRTGLGMTHTRFRDFHLPLNLARLHEGVLPRSLRPAARQGGLNPLLCAVGFLLRIVDRRSPHAKAVWLAR